MQRGAGGLIGRKILYYLRPCKNFFQKKITACCVCVKKIVYLRKPYSERVYPEGVIPGRLRWLWNYRGCSADCEIFSGKIREESGDFFIQCLLRSHFIEEERSRKYIIKKKEKERRNIGDEKKFGKNTSQHHIIGSQRWLSTCYDVTFLREVTSRDCWLHHANTDTQIVTKSKLVIYALT